MTAAYWVLAAHVLAITGASVRFVQDGWLAVDIFIVISGFLMYLVIAGGGAITARNAVGFYIRRFFRVAPCFYIAIFLYVWLRKNYVGGLVRAESHFNTAASVSGYVKAINARDVFAHLTFLHGLAPGTGTMIFGPAWSLSLEVQFYLVAPAFVFFLNRSPWLSLALAFAVNGLADKLFGVYGTHGRVADYFFPSLLANRLFMFVLGAVCCRYLVARASGDLGLFAATLAGSGLLFPRVSLLFCFALVGGVTVATLVRSPGVTTLNRLASKAPVQWLADWSYGVYLLHPLAMAAAAYVVFRPGTDSWPRPLLSACYVGAVVLISTGAAAALFYAVESPARNWGKRLACRFAGPSPLRQGGGGQPAVAVTR